MSESRIFRVKTRLSKEMSKPGGTTVAVALKRAEEALEEIRPPCLADIDATLALIDAKFGPAASGRNEESLDDLYLLATRVIDVAICLYGSGVDLAARALCELIDLSKMLDVRDMEALDVHIHALKLLRTAGLKMTKAQRVKVLDGLASVTRKRVGDISLQEQS